MSDINTTPVANPSAEAPDSTRDALFRALRLKAADLAPLTQANNEPTPDTGRGIEVPTSGVTRSNLAELVNELSKAPVVEVVPPVVPPAATPTSVVTAAATPTVVPPVVVPEVVPVVTPPVVTDAEKLKNELRQKLSMPEVPLATVATPTAPSEISLDMAGFDDEEMEAVRLANFAETANPTRYSGHTRRTYDHIKQVRAYKSQKRIDDPSIEFNEDNDEYQTMLRRAPGYERGERASLERKRLSAEIRQETLKEVAVTQQKLEQELRAVKAAPAVEKTVKSFKDYIDSELAINSEDGLERETARNVAHLAEGAAREFMLISTQLKGYDGKNGTHAWLANFIQEQGEVLQKSDAPQRIRGEKTFVPRAAFNSMPQTQKDKHFTFSDQEVLELIGINAKLAADQIVKVKREELEKYGYKNVKATPAPATTAAASVPPPVTPPNGVVPDSSPRGGIAPTVSGLTPVTPNQPLDPFQRMLMGKIPSK